MRSILEQELLAAGFTLVPAPVDGVLAFTEWQPPASGCLGVETTPDTYEIYYDLCGAAMYAQMDWSPWDRPHSTRSRAIRRQLVKEYRAVINCWRSASQVPPAPEAR